MTPDFYENLKGILKIPSVAVDGDERYPFGKDCEDALDYMLDLCKGFGFRTKKCANMLGYAEIGDGEEMLGILVHLDVVPAGNDWEYPAFDLTRITVDGEERLIGRGIDDDKGPALICVYAMKALVDSGVKLNRRVRIIFGLTEERGAWIDMDYYCKTEELPTFGFTPDASFPTAYGEKGIAHFELRMKKSEAGVDEVFGGNAANMVPDKCTCIVNGKTFTGVGKSAHGSTPLIGKNAILDCFKKINAEAPCGLSDFICRCFDEKCDGSLIGCAVSDEPSGELTLNVGVASIDGDDVVITIDIRYPVTASFSKIESKIIESLKKYNVKVVTLENKAPVYFDKDSALIKTLCKIYNKHSGKNAEPFVMGGGTYARAMPNIVSFGAGMSDSAHQKNEYVPEAKVDEAYKIYTDAILELTKIKL